MCMHAWAPHQPDAGPLNNRLSLLAASPSLRLLIWDLYYFIKHSFSLCMHVCGWVYFLPCSWLMALALAITWALNITNTIKSRLESLFIVGWGQCLWQLKAELYWKELHGLSRVCWGHCSYLTSVRENMLHACSQSSEYCHSQLFSSCSILSETSFSYSCCERACLSEDASLSSIMR